MEEIANEPDEDRKARSLRLATLRAEAAKGETRSVASIVADIASTRSLDVAPRSVEERKLAHYLQRAEIEALTRAAEHDRGEFAGVVKDPAIRPPTAFAPLVALPGESVMELFEIFVRDNPNGSTKETLEQSRAVIGLFSEFVGKQLPTSNISKKEVRDWKAALRNYPVKATETREFKGKDFRQTVDANRKIGKRTISEKTLNRYLAALGSYCKWLVAHGYLSDVPTTGMFVKVDKSRQKVFPYKIEELRAIFSSPLYTGCLSGDKPHKIGNLRIWDHR